MPLQTVPQNLTLSTFSKEKKKKKKNQTFGMMIPCYIFMSHILCVVISRDRLVWIYH